MTGVETPVGNATLLVGVGCATDGVVIPLEAVIEPVVVMPPGTVMPPGKDTAPPLAPVIEPSDAMVNVTPSSSLTVKSLSSISVGPANVKLGALAVAAPKDVRPKTLLLIVTGSESASLVPSPILILPSATVIIDAASLLPPLILKLGELSASSHGSGLCA